MRIGDVNMIDFIRQGYSLLFSFRIILDKIFDYLPIFLFFLNTLAYLYFITEFVIPVFNIYGEIPTDLQIITYATNNPNAERYLTVENFSNYFFELSMVFVLAIFAKSKGFRFTSKVCLVGLFMLVLVNGIYIITGMSIAFYYLLAFLVILCTFVILTISRLINKVK